MQKPKDLLHPEESNIPKNVNRVVDYFTKSGISFKLSRNEEAFSCRDAAQKRKRLGHTGIPLEDELKSYFGKFTNRKNNEQYVILHCRGDQEINESVATEIISSKTKIERLSGEELANIFNLEYGKVNPFNLDPLFMGLPVLQVFDKSLLAKGRLPHSMMTNAGELTWAVEFKPKELIDVIDHKVIAQICYDDSMAANSLPPQIGIITGNAPESGIYLWKLINRQIRRKMRNSFLGDISLPYISIESIPDLGLSMELDFREKETWSGIKEALLSLCRRGVDVICIPCNTIQYFNSRINGICKEYDIKYISMVETTLNHLEQNDINEFALLGVSYVTDFNDWSAFADLKGCDVEILSESSLNDIHRLAFKVKQEGATGKGLNMLRDLLKKSVKSENIVIALTEISILIDFQNKRHKSGKNYIDTLELLSEVVVQEYLAISDKKELLH